MLHSLKKNDLKLYCTIVASQNNNIINNNNNNKTQKRDSCLFKTSKL